MFYWVLTWSMVLHAPLLPIARSFISRIFMVNTFIFVFQGKYSVFLFLHCPVLLWRMFLLTRNIKVPLKYHYWAEIPMEPSNPDWVKNIRTWSFYLLSIFLYLHIFQSSKFWMSNSVGEIRREELAFRPSFLPSFSQP